MKEAKINRTTTEIWRWSDWGECEPDAVTVTVYAPGWPDSLEAVVRHESEIKRPFFDGSCPEAEEAVRREVMAHRKLAENEKRCDDRFIVQLRMTSEGLERRYLWLDGPCGVWGQFYGDIDMPTVNPTDAEVFAFARAWRDRQWQPVDGESEWEVRKLPNEAMAHLRNAKLKEENDHWYFYVSDAERDVVLRSQGGDPPFDLPVPEPVILACCKLLGVEREVPLADDEILMGGKVVKLEWDSRYGEVRIDKTCWSWKNHNRDYWVTGPEWLSDSERLTAYDRCKAFYDANKPAPKLEANQVRSPDDFTMSGRVVVSLRWHNGSAQYKWGNNDWGNAMLHLESAAFMRAWFRANCPIDRFVTDDGRVLEFQFDKESGEAFWDEEDGRHWTRSTHSPGGWAPQHEALLKYRDAERAKWGAVLLGKAGEILGHGPSNRFVTESGEVLEFRMRYDGEAEAISGDFKHDQTAAEQTQDSENWSDSHRALLRFRDAELAKRPVVFEGKWETIEHSLDRVTIWSPELPRTLPTGPIRVTIQPIESEGA